MKKSLSAYNIKLLAIFAMLLDHTAHLIDIAPVSTLPLAYLSYFMHIAGRLTMPIMCYFISEGYYHTKNLKKYLLNLFLFALISQIPYYVLFTDSVSLTFLGFIKDNIFGTNVLVTLFLGLCALALARAQNIPLIIRITGVLICIIFSNYSDWRIYGVLWVLAFGLFRPNLNRQFAAFFLITILRSLLHSSSALGLLLQFSSLLAIIPLLKYNGERGKKVKYLFYIFYPAHLILLAAIRYIFI